VALAALEKLVARGDVKAGDRVIVISTATGLKFTDYKVAYHARDASAGGRRFANAPIELPNDYDQVRRALDRLAPADHWAVKR
jgi:threonine synthase